MRVSVGAAIVIANAVDYVAELVEVVRRGYEIGRVRCAFALKFGESRSSECGEECEDDERE